MLPQNAAGLRTIGLAKPSAECSHWRSQGDWQGCLYGVRSDRHSPSVKRSVVVVAVIASAALAIGLIVVVLPEGYRKATVPAVSGRSLASAEARLAAQGFRWKVEHLDRGSPGATHPGTVLTQRPLPRTSAASGSTVQLNVWLAMNDGPDIATPDLVGMVQWEAYNAIVDRGLTADVLGPRRPGLNYPYWTIVSQSPRPGTELPVGSGRVTITMKEPAAVQVTAQIPTTECSFLQAPGVRVLAAYVITSEQLRRAPISDTGPLSRQAPGSEWRVCYATGRNVDPAIGGPAPRIYPGASHRVIPSPPPSGPRKAIYVYYRSGSLAEVVGLPSLRFVAVEGTRPAQQFPWLSEASV
jgi:PASTA domain